MDAIKRMMEKEMDERKKDELTTATTTTNSNSNGNSNSNRNKRGVCTEMKTVWCAEAHHGKRNGRSFFIVTIQSKAKRSEASFMYHPKL